MDIEKSSRFKDAPWYSEKETFVLVGGAGGIGSWLSLLLARANFYPTLYDFDTVEEHNIGGQLFPVDSIGRNKTEVVRSVVHTFTGKRNDIFNNRVDIFTTSNIVFSAFDNMEARKTLFTAWKQQQKQSGIPYIFIDGRLRFEQIQIFCVSSLEEMISYEENHLFSDSEVEEVECTLKQTSHSAALIASLMVSFLTNFITNYKNQSKDREVPFFYEYFIPLNLSESHDK